jgi:hypothetical protein
LRGFFIVLEEIEEFGRNIEGSHREIGDLGREIEL